MTLPVIKAVALADETEQLFWERTIEKGDQQDGDLEHAIALMTKHGTLQATRQDAIKWAEKARTALTKIPESKIRNLLIDLSYYVVSRVV